MCVTGPRALRQGPRSVWVGAPQPQAGQGLGASSTGRVWRGAPVVGTLPPGGQNVQTALVLGALGPEPTGGLHSPSCSREGRAPHACGSGLAGGPQGCLAPPEGQRGPRPQESSSVAFSVVWESACLDRRDGGAGRWRPGAQGTDAGGDGASADLRSLPCGRGLQAPREACAAGASGCGIGAAGWAPVAAQEAGAPWPAASRVLGTRTAERVFHSHSILQCAKHTNVVS